MRRALTRKLLRDAWRLRGPGAAVALVVAAGLATFTMAWSTVATLRQARDAFYEERGFADVFASVRRAPLAVVQDLRDIPGVADVADRVTAEATLEVPGFDEPVTARLVSLREGPADPSVHVRSGRLPEPGHAGEALVGEGLARAHGLREGSRLTLLIGGRRHDVVVVGVGLSPEHVYAIRPADVFPDDLRYGVLHVPRAALAAALDMDGAFNDVALRLGPAAIEADVIARVDAVLEPHGGLGAHGRESQLSHFYLSAELDQLRAMGRTAPTIFLAVAAFLVHVVLSRLVAAQRVQAATLRAFGYPASTVTAHYALLVLLAVALGAALGIGAGKALGAATVDTYADYYRFPAMEHRLSLPLVLAGVGLAAAVGLASATGAIVRVLRLPPAEAMRPEAPTSFRASALDRVGVVRAMRPTARMVLRRLARRPVRSAISCAALSLAVGILVLSTFPLDAVERLIQLQFELAQRDDLTVSLREPAAGRAIHELSRLPGVLAAEPYRALAVRLRHGHLTRRVGLVGVPAGSDLHRVLDGGRPVALPDRGIVLSASLASILDVEAGDPVVVEVLEGRRRTATVPVSLVVEQYVGLQATMEIDALHRALGEAPAISGARLAVDPPAWPLLVAALRDAPAVGTVSVRQASVDGLRRTMRETMLRMTAFNVLFSVIIAFGVVYDVARVALAEQARELATLRVLGHTRAETSWVLLGELGLLVAVALPLGLVSGRLLAELMARALETEMFRIPVVISPATQGFAVLVVAITAVVTALAMRRHVDRLDMVAVLKAAE